eukprot:m.206202 g.206202  ORF g.206202 m.206202 type:complete len:71 (+) comp18496_c1_seq12:203-415(+)
MSGKEEVLEKRRRAQSVKGCPTVDTARLRHTRHTTQHNNHPDMNPFKPAWLAFDVNHHGSFTPELLRTPP